MDMTENVAGFQHLGLPVSDIAASRDFYRKLGFEILSDQRIEEEGGTTYVSFLELKGFCLEIYQPPTGPDGPKGRGSIDHAALEVNDVDRAFAFCASRGIPVLEESPRFLPLHRNGVKYFNVSGPDGEKLEFIQILK